MNIQITVIIVNYNTSELLETCIKSILNESFQLSLEIIVVDNNSIDNSINMLKTRYPSVKVIANNFNAGFSKANNQGLAIASGKYTFLLNPDTIVLSKAIEHLYEFMENNPECGACGPRTWLDSDKSLEVCPLKLLTPKRAAILFTHHNQPEKFKELNAIWKHDANLWTAKKPLKVEGIGGAAVFMRTNDLKNIGGLDESFFMGYEDTDLCMTLSRQGKPIYIIPTAEIVHLFGQAKKLPQAPEMSSYKWNKGPLIFLTKHFGRIAGLKLTSYKTIDHIKKPFIKRSIPNNLYVINSKDLTLNWESSDSCHYVFELSNDFRFYDKFGKVVTEPSITVPFSFFSRIQSPEWFWRAWTASDHFDMTPITTGYITVDNKIA